MSKITFRADDDLIDQLEAFDASKSEVMREALREYLGDASPSASEPSSSSESVTDAETIDELIEERVDSIIADRLGARRRPSQPQDINVNISLDGVSAGAANAETERRQTADRGASAEDGRSHSENQSSDTSGRKTEPETRDRTDTEERKTCAQCGDNLGPDHVYCPNCGEKASRRVFCDCGDELRSDWGFCPGCGRRTPAADVLDQT
ncbi:MULTISPECIES: zinc ribbon domain-containing protein [unclassified Haloarcula]|uniref:zinc ribbon domain-containing protein n=1 Tax=unclassified Haloarcula TaxID=2624677 RepID=UPI000EF214F6|nr:MULTISPECIES: zinc ribbon domain-containing protein [unclassified Haloarcula]RLM40349.1 zinc ribbon domain-containing protein [Haloarcula sp. Atlit-120R]RLM48368.1 zinc ribbon domain-containing protein [Haloarcula sp. Atlit-47R]